MIGIKIPWQVFACTGLVGAFFLYGHIQYNRGQDEVQRRWTESIDRGKLIVSQLKQKQTVVTEKIVPVYVDRVKTIKEKGDVIVRQVTKFVPADSCTLPGGFRVLYDAAVTNTIPDSAEGTNAEPVPAQDLATSIAENYQTCNSAITELKGLRQWVEEQSLASQTALHTQQ